MRTGWRAGTSDTTRRTIQRKDYHGSWSIEKKMLTLMYYPQSNWKFCIRRWYYPVRWQCILRVRFWKLLTIIFRISKRANLILFPLRPLSIIVPSNVLRSKYCQSTFNERPVGAYNWNLLICLLGFFYVFLYALNIYLPPLFPPACPDPCAPLLQTPVSTSFYFYHSNF